MPINLDFVSAENYSEKQQRMVQRVLNLLARNDQRFSEHYNPVRKHQRQHCHNLLTIRVPGGMAEEAVEFSVYMRDISPRGTSFVYPGMLDLTEILIGIPIPGRDMTWFQGKVVRCKQIMEEDFWEYGVKFTQRLDV